MGVYKELYFLKAICDWKRNEESQVPLKEVLQVL